MPRNATEAYWLAQMEQAEQSASPPDLTENTAPQSLGRTVQALTRTSQQQHQPTPKSAGHAVAKLADARTKSRQAEAFALMQQARKSGLTPDLIDQIDSQLKANANDQEKWIFVMLGAKENAAVIRWINANSKRPRQAVELWATILENLRIDTGEITKTRQELAERVGMTPRDLSSTMTELASINAIRREKEGRGVTYFLNPQIATHLPNKAARTAARKAAGPLLTLMEGGKKE